MGMISINIKGHQRNPSLDPHKKVIEIVRDAPSQSPDRFHFLSMQELGFELPTFSNIISDTGDAAYLPVLSGDSKAFIRNPGKLIYVVDGDLHVAPNHLPGDVEHLLKQLDEVGKIFIVFQNAENLYWKF